MVAGPEISRVIEDFEKTCPENDKSNLHHEQKHSTFKKQVIDFVEVVTTLNNPFTELSNDLYALYTKDIADRAVVDSINKIEDLEKGKYDTFKLLKRD